MRILQPRQPKGLEYPCQKKEFICNLFIGIQRDEDEQRILCPHSFATRDELAHHKQWVHTVLDLEKCPKCHRDFQTIDECENHDQYCPRRFGRVNVRGSDAEIRRWIDHEMDRMRIERIRNSRPKAITCPLCPKKFERVADFQRHKKSKCSGRGSNGRWMLRF